jgi:hypothetical protein
MTRKLKVTTYPDIFPVWFDEMKGDGSLTSPVLVSKKYLEKVQKTWHIFDETNWAFVQNSAAAIRKSSYARAYINLMFRFIKDRALFREVQREKKLPYPRYTTPEPLLDSVLIFPLIPLIIAVMEDWKVRKVPEKVIMDTVKSMDTSLYINLIRYDRVFMNEHYFNWLQHAIDGDILFVNRLEFEFRPFYAPCIVLTKKGSLETVVLADGAKIHRNGFILGSKGCEDAEGSVEGIFEETPEGFFGYPTNAGGRFEREKQFYSKEEWEISVRKQDPILLVHIPRRGSLKAEFCRESYRNVLEFVPRCFPATHIKAIVCHSWMMSGQMDEVVEAPSNLLDFQNNYTLYPLSSQGTAIFSFVFHRPVENHADLPENTRLEKAMKERTLAGIPFYEGGGVSVVKNGTCSLVEGD